MSLFSTKGRLGRAHYFLHSVGSFVFMLVLIVALGFIPEGGVADTIGLVVFFAGLAALVVSEVCVTVRRLHDLGRNGSQYVLLVIPLYNIYLGCILLFQRGTVGPNAYGDDPILPPFHERQAEAIAR